MVRWVIHSLIILALIGATLPSPSMAADEAEPETHVTGPRKQLATIIFAGLAGAVLGLSTLSFYGRPQDKLSNIGVGAAIGVIIGAGYTTYTAATQPRQLYGQTEPELWLPQVKEMSKTQPLLLSQWSWSF
jgi:hypothetical protein